MPERSAFAACLRRLPMPARLAGHGGASRWPLRSLQQPWVYGADVLGRMFELSFRAQLE
jgi:hypothetical protein